MVQATEAGVAVADVQKEGYDNGTTVQAMLSDEDIVALATELLGL